MYTGVVDTDSLTVLFRNVSQKRRHGVLRLDSDSSSLEVLFVSGKITEVREVGWSSTPAVYERLRAAQRLAHELADSIDLSQLSVIDLYEMLVKQELASHDDFMLARSALALDMLHGVASWAQGVYNFDSRLVDFDERISLRISPGQLLLDFVELETNREKLKQVFSAFRGCSIEVVTSEDPGLLNSSEAELWGRLSRGGDLEARLGEVLLCENDLRAHIVSFVERGIVELLAGEGTNSIAEWLLGCSDAPGDDGQNGSDAAQIEAPISSIEGANQLAAQLAGADSPTLTSDQLQYLRSEMARREKATGFLGRFSHWNYWALTADGRSITAGALAISFLIIVGFSLPFLLTDLLTVISRSVLLFSNG